jgi:hypothetical protein
MFALFIIKMLEKIKELKTLMIMKEAQCERDISGA